MELKQAEPERQAAQKRPFNRTLWNWNPQNGLLLISGTKLLIVPYGIET